MLVVLHGISALKILAILGLNYLASTTPKPPALGKIWPAVLIVGNLGLLFLNEQYEGYKLGRLHAMFDPLVGASQLGGEG